MREVKSALREILLSSLFSEDEVVNIIETHTLHGLRFQSNNFDIVG